MNFDHGNSQYETAHAYGGYAGSDSYGDGDVPEIDTVHYRSDASDTIPEEIPARRSASQEKRREK